VLITADLNDDGFIDFIVSEATHIAMYDHSGRKLWIKRVNLQVTGKGNENDLPGWHGPGGKQLTSMEMDTRKFSILRKTELCILSMAPADEMSAPEFHHDPRPLLADFNDRSVGSPRCIRRAARV
jgi:hypothetical protein